MKFDDNEGHKDLNRELERYKNLVRVINEAHTGFVQHSDVRTLFEHLLTGLLEITNSEYGFIGEVLKDADGSSYLKMHAITNIAWDAASRKFYEENASDGLEFLNLDTLFGKVITSGAPVISNEPNSDPRATGIPGGHPDLSSFMGLPFSFGNELVGMIGIANKPDGYDQEYVSFLAPILASCANIVQAFRNDRLRLEAEAELKKSQTFLDSVIENIPNMIFLKDAKELRFHHFNRAGEELLGMSKEELIGKNDYDFFPKEQADFFH